MFTKYTPYKIATWTRQNFISFQTLVKAVILQKYMLSVCIYVVYKFSINSVFSFFFFVVKCNKISQITTNVIMLFMLLMCLQFAINLITILVQYGNVIVKKNVI